MMKLRKILQGLVAIMVIIFATACSGDSGQETKTDTVEFLLVQNADGITLNDGQLRLMGFSPSTLYFSDRPDRIVGRVTKQEYVDSWGKGDNSFKNDPPNAALSIPNLPDPQDIVVELHNPSFDGEDLIYNVGIDFAWSN